MSWVLGLTEVQDGSRGILSWVTDNFITHRPSHLIVNYSLTICTINR